MVPQNKRSQKLEKKQTTKHSKSQFLNTQFFFYNIALLLLEFEDDL
jgi:hypothetical protein